MKRPLINVKKNLKNSKTRKITRTDGLFYHPTFVSNKEKEDIVSWLQTLRPIWEWRYSEHNPPPPGETQRKLLRPVYWLGNWQFACLNYYHPPKGIHNRCIQAEAFPTVLQKLIKTAEEITRMHFKKSEVPTKWHLNTCLINYYGTYIDESGKKIDTARVGDHKDFEIGPVVSISFGERAFFQFVMGKKNKIDNILYEQWLDDCSLLIFGGDLYKERAFHRVQRVENKIKNPMPFDIDSFETRRLNFTFRYVPNEHIKPFHEVPSTVKSDIMPYMLELSNHSLHFKEAILKNEK
jgi:alkylated DNA repair protein (DNA oxidative demethylase)